MPAPLLALAAWTAGAVLVTLADTPTPAGPVPVATTAVGPEADTPTVLPAAATPVPPAALTPVPLPPDAFTPIPPAELPYTPQPLPLWEPQVPTPSPPVPLFCPRTAAEKPPGLLLEMTPWTAMASAAVLRLSPNTPDPPAVPPA